MIRRMPGRGGRRTPQFAANIPRLFPSASRHRDCIQQELVALASHVTAVASSAQCILSKVPDGPERQRLVHACEQLVRAADEVVDPRSEIERLSEPGLEDAIHAFVGYQEQSASVRSAALAVAGKRERAPRILRQSDSDQQLSGARCSAMATRRESSTSWTLRIRTRIAPRSAPGSAWSLGLVWRYIGKVLEGCIPTRRSGA
jgi:hypothetical protein